MERQAHENKSLQTRFFEFIEVDSLMQLDNGEKKPMIQRESRLLMRQMQQLSRVVKVISLILLVMSLIYMYTRVGAYKDMRRSLALSELNYVYKNKFDHIVELHYFLIGHSIACVVISIWSFLTVDKNYVIDRRQYFILLGVSTAATFSYFLALGYVVLSTSQYFSGESTRSSIVNFFEGVLELIQSISRNQLSFFFAVIMNFALLYGVFALNMCSMYLVEVAKSLEQRRTGGRGENEVELGGYQTR